MAVVPVERREEYATVHIMHAHFQTVVTDHCVTQSLVQCRQIRLGPDLLDRVPHQIELAGHHLHVLLDKVSLDTHFDQPACNNEDAGR